MANNKNIRTILYPVAELGDLCNITTGKVDANAMVPNGKYKFFTCSEKPYSIDKYNFNTEALLISGNGAKVGYIHYYKGKFNAYQRTYVLDKFSQDIQYIKYFLQHYLKHRIHQEKSSGNTPYIKLGAIKNMQITLPPLNIQKKVANTLSTWDEAIDKQSQLISEFKKHLSGLAQSLMDKESNAYPLTELGDAVKVLLRGQNLSRDDLKAEGNNACIHYGQLYTKYGATINEIVSHTDKEGKALSKYGDVLIPGTTTADALGISIASALLKDNVLLGGDINILRLDGSILDSIYLAYLVRYPLKRSLSKFARGTNILHLIGKDIMKLKISFPPLDTQKNIANILSTWDKAIDKQTKLLSELRSQKQWVMQQLFSH